MADRITSERKNDLCNLLALYLPALRAKAGFSQDDLVDRLGFTRQTISAIENEKREMQWSTFTAMTLFFSRDREIMELMVVMGIIDSSVDELLNVEKRVLAIVRSTKCRINVLY